MWLTHKHSVAVLKHAADMWEAAPPCKKKRLLNTIHFADMGSESEKEEAREWLIREWKVELSQSTSPSMSPRSPTYSPIDYSPAYSPSVTHHIVHEEQTIVVDGHEWCSRSLKGLDAAPKSS